MDLTPEVVEAVAEAFLNRFLRGEVARADKEVLPEPVKAAVDKKLAAIAWRQGALEYKLDPTQQKIQAAIEGNGRRQFFALCSRRTGKSYLFLLRLFAKAIKKPGGRFLFLAPTKNAAAEIAGDLAVGILQDCPEELRPQFNQTLKEFRFQRGNNPESIIRLKGVNGETFENLRGGAQDEIILDEFCQMDRAKNILESVCMPMTLSTRGRILMASTPPTTTGHESVSIYNRLSNDGATVKFTIRDNDRYPLQDRAEMLREIGEEADEVYEILAGTKDPKTTTAQREYFCEMVTDASLAVIPEYNATARREILKSTIQRPEFFEAYVSMDPGIKDRTGILFAYWDFLRAKLVIEDELNLDHPGTPDIAKAIKDKEAELWGGRWTPRRFLDCSGDGGLRLIADLKSQYGLSFSPAQKQDRMSAVNLLRRSVQIRELEIHERCKHLDRQLGAAVWNRRATEMQRGDEIDGHFDLVASAIYLCRSVSRKSNPYPEHYYHVGGRLGLPQGTFISPKSRRNLKPATIGDKATPLEDMLFGPKKK